MGIFKGSEMNLDLLLSTELKDLRKEIHNFLEEERNNRIFSKIYANRDLTKEDHLEWYRKLSKRGWLIPHWPKEHGGQDWSPVKYAILERELALADAPPVSPFGVSMIGPVLYTFGSKYQIEKYLPGIAKCRHLWCQGYSEPEAGSDLASLRTKATRSGSDYIVNGHKLWTSEAHWADYMFCLVKMEHGNEGKHAISMLLIDMKSPGITVDPIITIDNKHHINQVFLDDVRVPAENLIGEENQAWSIAKFLLEKERTSVAEVGRSRRNSRNLHELILSISEERNIKPAEKYELLIKLKEIIVDLDALELTQLWVLSSPNADTKDALTLKIKGSEIQKRITDLAIRVIGPDTLTYDSMDSVNNNYMLCDNFQEKRRFLAEHLWNRATSIYGGTNEVLRNVIARNIIKENEMGI